METKRDLNDVFSSKAHYAIYLNGWNEIAKSAQIIFKTNLHQKFK
jgi:hypothetical protein